VLDLSEIIYAAGGLVAGVVIGLLVVAVIIMIKNRRGQRARETEKRHKIEFSKLILALVLIPYFYAAYIGGEVVRGDTSLLPLYLGFIAAPTSAAIGFYTWKAKAENVVKIKRAYPEETTRFDITTLTT